MKQFPKLSGLFALLFIIASCEFKDRAAVTVPAYVCIPSFTFITDTSDANYQGRNTHNFTDMWLNQDGLLIGGIGLPVMVPVQKLGKSDINVDAGIMVSGQDDSRAAYPITATYTERVNLEAGVVDTIRPVFRYFSNAKFPLISDYDKVFTTRGFVVNPVYASPGDTLLKANDQGSVEPGNNYIRVAVSSASTAFQMYTSEEYELPGLGVPVYLEMDYHSNVQLQVGYYYQELNQPSSSAIPVIELYSSSGWKKVYLKLTDEISSKKAGTLFKFYIGFFNLSGMQPDVSFDNIKLITVE